MNELVRNQCHVTNHQVNVRFLLQLQPEWQRFVTIVKKSQELKTVSDHKLYDILKQHQNEVNKIRARAERLAHHNKLLPETENIYKPTNNNLETSSNTRNKNRDTSPRNRNDNQTGQFVNQRTVTVVGARESCSSSDRNSMF
ncbi:hypothetical protein Tco_0136185 [Tanacetum coccineum]